MLLKPDDGLRLTSPKHLPCWLLLFLDFAKAIEETMVFAKSLDKTLFLYTDHADNTDSAVKRRKNSVHSMNSVYKEA